MRKYVRVCSGHWFIINKTEFKMETYLTQVTHTSHRRTLTKLRLSDHKLEIENGRHIRPNTN